MTYVIAGFLLFVTAPVLIGKALRRSGRHYPVVAARPDDDRSVLSLPVRAPEVLQAPRAAS